MPKVSCAAQELRVCGLLLHRISQQFICCVRPATTIRPLFTILIWNKSFLDCSHRFCGVSDLSETQCSGCVLCAQVGLATKRPSNTVWPQFGLFVGVNWTQSKQLRSLFSLLNREGCYIVIE